jgi:hypothetical protein
MKKAKSLSRWFKQTGFHAVARHSFTEPHFGPHTKSIGSLLLAWNDLHERLSTLFVMAMGLTQFARSFAVWHETRSDVNKRRLLRAAIKNLPSSEFEGRPKVIEEITWILDVADKLEGPRDDSAHTPLRYDFPISTLAEAILNPLHPSDITVAPQTGFANPRALRIYRNNQDMNTERRYARERILVLGDYAMAVDYAWANARLPWPERPDLPERRPNRRSKAAVSHRKKK